MESRARNSENKIALSLSTWMEGKGFSPIQRQPILGRKGPDFTINELKLVVDAKSRLSCPKSYSILAPEVIQANNLVGVRLCDLDLLLEKDKPNRIVPASLIVSRWWTHMDDWRLKHMPNGITVVILHYPGTTENGKHKRGKNFENSTFVFRASEWEVLRERVSSQQQSTAI